MRPFQKFAFLRGGGAGGSGGAVDPLAAIFAGGETGDFWRFDADNTDASVPTDPITTATGLVNGLSMTSTGTITLVDVDGQQAAKFTNGGRLTHAFGSTVSQPGTVIVAVRDTQAVGSGLARIFYGGPVATTRWQMSIDTAGDLSSICDATEIDSGVHGPLGKAVISAEYNGTSSSVRVDGIAIKSGQTLATTGTTGLVLGESPFDSNTNYTGEIFALFFIDRLLTTDERDYIEGLMAGYTAMPLGYQDYDIADLSPIFASGEEGDVWSFDPTNLVTSGAITTVTGLINGLNLTVPAGTGPNLGKSDDRWVGRFSGNRMIHAFGSTLTQAGTIILGIRSADTNTHAIVTGSGSSSRWQLSNDSGDDLIAFANSELDSGLNAPVGHAAIGALFNGASSAYYKDGSVVATGNVGTQGTNQITIGALWDGTFSLTGDIFAVFIVDRELTAGELSDVFTYMAARSNV